MTELLHASVAGHAKIEVEAGPEPVWVDADATQIRQVVMNFIINASEALRGDVGRVTLRTGIVHADHAYLESCYTREDLDEGEFALLEVSDDGIGMDLETATRIFDPFFTTKSEGRGLGLAATLGIVRSHRGAIRVESQPGNGTTIQVLLPLVSPASPSEEATPPVRTPRRAKILVVDDEDIVRTVGRRMLEARGYEVVEAASGHGAANFLKAQGEDVAAVLLDLTMPRMDGEQTLKALRATGRTTFVGKPFRLSELTGALESLLADPAASPTPR